ncbi:MBL fold metallo-hydrolase [Roseomonas sp. CCTCC AB2023176]|uniref:MBL fold metallo-hydrolase n=1 Tax=Roseomonas sp. CCTCC AB2023176 TaxID=3342640 RepID=UPI0035D5695B
MAKPEVAGFHDPRTGSVQYVVSDPATRRCAIIDPVLDFDQRAGCVTARSADALLAHVAERGLQIEWILDTHPHADHFSAAATLKERTGAPMAMGARIVDVQRLWSRLYGLPDLPCDGSAWDRLFADGERFRIGGLDVEVIHSPGHTLASVTYVVGDAAFIHDTLFMPDGGTARCDFPGGSATALWRSIQRVLSLPDATRLFTGHDYRPGGREPCWESTVAEQRAANIHLTRCADEAAYVAMREARDRTLPIPDLMLLALQVNIRGGRLPEPNAGGVRCLSVPLDVLPDCGWR